MVNLYLFCDIFIYLFICKCSLEYKNNFLINKHYYCDVLQVSIEDPVSVNPGAVWSSLPSACISVLNLIV